jgi:citrate lyase beta subunit
MELSLLRSLLFAPAAEDAKVRKALASRADAVIADLEDGTAPDEKDTGREIVQALYSEAGPGRVRGLRVNPPGSEWFDRDLELARGLLLDFLMLPKATPDTVAALGPAGPPVLAIVETASGLRRADETAAAERVFALALGSHDLGAELRTEPRPDGLELLYPRSKVVTDSAAARLRPPFDTVYLDVRDPAGLEAECRLARTLGFRGKLCIHPDQLETVTRVFAASEEEVAWARRVVSAYEQGLREGRGAVALDGRMVDLAVLRRAQAVLADIGSRDDRASEG